MPISAPNTRLSTYKQMKDTKEPLIILLVLFVIIGLAYSPLKKAAQNRSSSASSSSKNISAIGTKTSTTGSSSNSSEFEYSPNKEVAGEIKEAEKDIKKLQENTTESESGVNRSPYYDKIRMSRVSGLNNSDPSKEYITLSTNLKTTEVVKITGWYFKSMVTGNTATIGKASLLPFPFTETPSSIVLQKGDRAIITKGFSPIGISFRTNVCTGYFEENRTFTPSLSLKCPLAKDENLPLFSSIFERNDECLKIIERIPRCRTKDYEYLRDLPDTVTDSCKNYITAQVNYNACVAKHYSDTSFPGNEYRVYLNRFGPLWLRRNEKVNLYDENSMIVDSISW